ALAQGTRPEDLFLVPEQVALARIHDDESGWLEQLAGVRPGITLFAAADSDIQFVLRAFAVLAEEVEDAHLLIECADAKLVERHAAQLDLGARMHPVGPSDRARALACATIVIAGANADGPNPLVLGALAHGRALLAADVPANREVTPHGRGCLWYAANSARDLAFRAAFLARNADFASALGATGSAHLQATRGASAVARRYDAVYRHAAERHRGGPDLLHRVPALAPCC
ncbi:MAG: glycosyltransferase, partial [Terriglobales bacterium]